MACRIHYNRKGEITGVLTKEGNISKLFNDIKREFDLSPSATLKLYTLTETPWFAGAYDGAYDTNQEPMINDAKDILAGHASDLFFADSLNEKLLQVGLKYGMDVNGYMDRNIDTVALDEMIRSKNVKNAGFDTLDNGKHYLTLNGRLYNPMRPQYYQGLKNIRSDQDRLEQALDYYIRELGIQVRWTDELGSDVMAKTNVMTRVIELAEGKATIEDLTEEVVHVLVSMMRGSPEYARLATAVMNMPVFRETMDSYGNRADYWQGDVQDTEKLVEEAMVKQLKSMMQMPDEKISRTWFQQIMDWLRRTFSPDPVVRATYRFKQTAHKILNTSVENLTDTPVKMLSNEVFYSAIKPNKAKQDMVLRKFDAWNAAFRDKTDSAKYTIVIDGKVHVVDQRVSDIVDKERNKMWRKAEYASPEAKKMYTNNGTLLHMYSELIMTDLMGDNKDKTGITRENWKKMHIPALAGVIKKRYADEVRKRLKASPEFDGREDSFFDLTESQFNAIAMTVGSLFDSIMTKDPDAVIRMEQKIYDSRRDVAGTIDVVVVYSDGTIGLFDYKTVQLKSYAKVILDMDPRKIEAYDLQLSEYRNILMSETGLSESDFAEMRIIPYSVTYKDQKVNTLSGAVSGEMRRNKKRMDLWIESAKGRYLDMISVGDEIKPGDLATNTFLKKLYNQRQTIEREWKASKGKKKRQLRQQLIDINKAVSSLLVLENMDMLYRDLENAYIDIKLNHTKMSAMQLRSSLAKMQMFQKMYNAVRESEAGKMSDRVEGSLDRKLGDILKSYEKISEVLKDRMPKTLTSEMDPAVFWSATVDEAVDILHQEMINRASVHLGDNYNDPPDGKKILQGTHNMTFDSASVLGMGTIDEPVLKVIAKLLNDAEERQKIDYTSYENRINRIDEEYREWGKANGFTGMNMFDPLLNEKKELITPYQSRFYEERDKIRESAKDKKRLDEDYEEEMEWLKDHLMFDREMYLSHYKEREEEWAEMSVLDRKRAQQDFEKYDPEKNENAYLETNNIYLNRPKDPSDPIMAEYVSKEWKFLQENPPAMAYHQMHTEMIRDIMSFTNEEMLKYNFVGNFRKSFLESTLGIESMSSAGKGLGSAIMTGIKNAFFLQETDEMFGYFGGDGQQVNRIPIIGIQPIRTNMSDREIEQIRRQVEVDMPSATEDEMKQEVQRRKYEEENKRALKEKSTDLTKSLKLLMASALDYKYKKEIEDEVMMTREIMNTDYYQADTVNKFGEKLESIVGKKPLKMLGQDNKTKEHVDKFIRMNLYGQYHQGKDIRVAGKLSAAKVVDTTHKYLTAKSLGFNVILGTASFVNAMLQSKFLAEMNNYYSKDAWNKAGEGILNVSAKTYGFLSFVDPISKNTQYERAELSTKSSWLRRLSMRNLMFSHRGGGEKQVKDDPEYKKKLLKKGYKNRDKPLWGDDYVGNRISVAVAHDWVLDSDGKIKKKDSLSNPPIDKSAKSMYELFNHEVLLTEDITAETIDKVFPGLSFEEYTRFKRIIGRAQWQALGKTNLDTMSTMNSTIVGRLMFKFRDWIPGLAYARFSGDRVDDLTGEVMGGWTWGTLKYIFSGNYENEDLRKVDVEVTALAYHFKYTIGPALKKMAIAGFEMATMGIAKNKLGHKFNPKAAQVMYNTFMNENRNLDPEVFTLENFIEFKQRQWNATIMEGRWALMALGAIAMILKNFFGADDDEAPLPLKWMYELTERSQLELNFFWSWKSVTDIISTPFVFMSIIDDLLKVIDNTLEESAEWIGLIEENKRDRSPWGYYTMKNIPGLRQALRLAYYFPMYNDQKSFMDKVLENMGTITSQRGRISY